MVVEKVDCIFPCYIVVAETLFEKVVAVGQLAIFLEVVILPFSVVCLELVQFQIAFNIVLKSLGIEDKLNMSKSSPSKCNARQDGHFGDFWHNLPHLLLALEPVSSHDTMRSPSWIIDSRASNHTTGMTSLFFSYHVLNKTKFK